MTKIFEEIGRIVFHENGGFTRVLVERTIGVGLADGGIELSIPAEKIPPDLKKIGSRFILVGNYEDINSLEIKKIN